MQKRTVCLCAVLICLCLGACRPEVPVDAVPPSRTGAYYQALGEREQTAYRKLYAGLSAMEDQITLQLDGKEAFDRVFQAVLNDYPELISVRHQGELVRRRLFVQFRPQYASGKEEAALRGQKLQEKISAVKRQVLREGMDAFEKELALHDWLAENCSYDSEALENGADTDIYTAFGALVSGRAVCEGYAKAFALLLRAADVPCTLVSGRAKQDGEWESHMWNAVELDGEFYYVDPTWNDNEEEPGLVMHTYFNITTQQLLRDHEIEAGAVDAKSSTQNYFVRRGLWFSQYDDDAKAALRQALERDMAVEIAFSSEEAFAYAVERLVQRQQIHSLYSAARPGEDIRNIKYILNELQRTMLFQGA